MKYLFLLLFLVACGGTYEVETEPIEGGTSSTFGPDFEAWLNYCKGRAQYKFEIGEITQNEIDIETKDCYYNVDFSVPQLPEDIDTIGE
jgi:hypothetical protein